MQRGRGPPEARSHSRASGHRRRRPGGRFTHPSGPGHFEFMGDHLGPWNLALVTVASYDSNLADAASRGLVRLAAPAADAAATAFGAFGAFGAGAHPREFGAVAPRLADALLLGLTFLDALDVDQRLEAVADFDQRRLLLHHLAKVLVRLRRLVAQLGVDVAEDAFHGRLKVGLRHHLKGLCPRQSAARAVRARAPAARIALALDDIRADAH
mmetsp:Transcript_7255/g.25928  ORF Transcript_7255/g.25928 Transcript_7255/m.25928 type:complete len:212 (-) Transcript_7255:1182-1817(-)